MNKKTLLVSLLLLSTGVITAQKEFKRNELSFVYGYHPTSDWIDLFSDGISSIVGMNTKNNKSLGAVSVMYNYRINRIFGIGAAVSYSNHNKDLFIGDEEAGKRKLDYITVLPRVKAEWFHSDVVTMYSSVAIGATLTVDDIDGDKDESTRIAWQFSPFGIEIGRKVAGFAEVGIGQLGIAMEGLRFRF